MNGGIFIKKVIGSLVLGAFLLMPATVQAATITHIVKTGESLFTISQKYNVSVNDLKNNNGLKSDIIYSGQKLLVSTDETIHTVKAGESLYLIGKKYGVSVESIKKTNNLNSNNIVVGQKLVINKKAEDSWYTVKKGDTLFLIGKKYGIAAQELMKYNGLKNTNLQIGQKLRIPSGSISNNSVSRSASINLSQDDIYWLAKTVYAEARGEIYKGQVAVASVIINRIKSADFPNSVKEVIYEPYAFSCVADGQIYLEPDVTAYKAVREAINGTDITNGSLYYWNPTTSTSKWIWSRKIIVRIGNHVFGI